MADYEIEPFSVVCSWIKVIPLLQGMLKVEPNLLALATCQKKVNSYVFFQLYHFRADTSGKNCQFVVKLAVNLFITQGSNWRTFAEPIQAYGNSSNITLQQNDAQLTKITC